MKKPSCLVVIGAFILFTVGAWLAAQILYPERNAYAGECVSRVDGALQNVCDRPVVAALCRENPAGPRKDDPCETQTLQPGEIFSSSLDTRLTGRPYTLACEAPYVPGWRASNSNQNLFQKTCRKPDNQSGQSPADS